MSILSDNLSHWWRNCWLMSRYYTLKAFFINLKIFIPLAYNWRPWDSHYTINVLIQLLYKQAHCLKHGLNMDSETLYRRCMTAAGYLDRANNSEPASYRSWIKLCKKNTILSVDIESEKHTEIAFNYIKDKKYYRKMSNLIAKRVENDKEQMHEYAWEYLAKHIRSLWD